MMNPSKLFENLFDDVKITSTRLANFATDFKNRLIASDYPAVANILNYLNPPLDLLLAELGEVKSTVNVQLSETQTLDNFIAQFKTNIKSLYNGIAFKLGGENVPAFLQFFPNGIAEYNQATKTQMPTLLINLETAAIKYEVTLGPEITKQLKEYKTTWLVLRDTQEQAKGKVGDNRTDRSQARVATEAALMEAIHDIGKAYPVDVQKCLSFFNFSMLLPHNPGSATPLPPLPPVPPANPQG